MTNTSFTPEQDDIRDAFSSGIPMVVKALAGTGKTYTLKGLATDHPELSMTYAAFNTSIANEARAKFPRNVTCRTMHSFAFQAVGRQFAERLEAGSVPPWETARILKIPSSGFKLGQFSLMDKQLARLVNESVGRFCRTTDLEPGSRHIPRVPGLDTPEARHEFAQFLLPYVTKAWEDLTNPAGQLKFSHDVYLKLWQMGTPELPGDVILFDEAQDADPVILDVIQQQRARGARIVPVGDENQQIYAWRGAVQALDDFGAEVVLPLQKTFRFGPAIAERANLLLSALDTELRLVGHEPVGSQLAELDAPDTLLCRTNAQAVAELMVAQLSGKRAGLVGGTNAVQSLAKAARDLNQGRRTYHPELMAFTNWAQVQNYVTDYPAESRDIAVLVKLVDRFGPDDLLDAVERAVPEREAELVISTAHKAKGREWDAVRLASDFADPRDETGEWREDELRLQYVAVTRAMKLLDDRILDSWVKELDPSGEAPERLAAVDVPAREVIEVDTQSVLQSEQVITDPESADMLVMHKTRYNPELVAAQRELPGRRYRSEYCGMEKVNVVRATARVLEVADRFKLTVSAEARERVENLGLA